MKTNPNYPINVQPIRLALALHTCQQIQRTAMVSFGYIATASAKFEIKANNLLIYMGNSSFLLFFFFPNMNAFVECKGLIQMLPSPMQLNPKQSLPCEVILISHWLFFTSALPWSPFSWCDSYCYNKSLNCALNSSVTQRHDYSRPANCVQKRKSYAGKSMALRLSIS